jgi:hypothetical protein
MSATDLLLYPMGEATDRPVCNNCGVNMTLAKFEAQRGSPNAGTAYPFAVSLRRRQPGADHAIRDSCLKSGTMIVSTIS